MRQKWPSCLFFVALAKLEFLDGSIKFQEWFGVAEYFYQNGCNNLMVVLKCLQVRSLVGDRVALLVQTVGAILIACIFGLVVAWPLALVMMALQPIVIIGFYLKKVLLKSMSAATYKAQEEASQV